MMRTRAEVATAAGAMRDHNNNQPPSPGIYPDYPAPVVLIGEDGQREMRDMRWGLPSPNWVTQKAAKERAEKLRAKVKEYDWEELLRMEPASPTSARPNCPLAAMDGSDDPVFTTPVSVQLSLTESRLLRRPTRRWWVQ